MEKLGGNGLHLLLISATPSYFAFLRWHQNSSRLVTVFLRTLWCSNKKIEAPYMFYREFDIALHEMQGNQTSSPSEGYGSWHFSSCGRNVGYILELQRGWPFETPLCSAKSGLLSSYDGHLRNQIRLERIIQMLLEVRWETKRSFLVSRKILGFLSIFKKSQASYHWSIELHEPLEVSRDEAHCPDVAGN